VVIPKLNTYETLYSFAYYIDGLTIDEAEAAQEEREEEEERLEEELKREEEERLAELAAPGDAIRERKAIRETWEFRTDFDGTRFHIGLKPMDEISWFWGCCGFVFVLVSCLVFYNVLQPYCCPVDPLL